MSGNYNTKISKNYEKRYDNVITKNKNVLQFVYYIKLNNIVKQLVELIIELHL
jgi:hypothetical protein